MPKDTPTIAFYKALQDAYDLFNFRLFQGKLDNSLITLQRQANTFGYMSYNRFRAIDSQSTYAHELALNPDYFGVKPLLEILQTMVHEMVHLWQYQYGTPSQKSYHNREWAEKMEQIGLMPSDTGRIGGKKIGQHMADYPIDGGLFLSVCNDLVKQGFIVKWYDKYQPKKTTLTQMLGDRNFAEMQASAAVPDSLLQVPHLPAEADQINLAQLGGMTEVHITQPVAVTNQTTISQENLPKGKLKHSCPVCKNNLWGKASLRVLCLDCDVPFELAN